MQHKAMTCLAIMSILPLLSSCEARNPAEENRHQAMRAACNAAAWLRKNNQLVQLIKGDPKEVLLNVGDLLRYKGQDGQLDFNQLLDGDVQYRTAARLDGVAHVGDPGQPKSHIVYFEGAAPGVCVLVQSKGRRVLGAGTTGQTCNAKTDYIKFKQEELDCN